MGKDYHYPDREGVTSKVVRTIPTSRHREMRVSALSSLTGKSVRVQFYAIEDGEADPVGRPFFVFRRELDSLIEAMAEARTALDAMGT